MFPLKWNFPFRKKDGSLVNIADAMGGDYSLPTASANTKGGIKVGNGLSMDSEVLNNSNPTPYSLPTASSDTKGGVKIGSGLKMDDEKLQTIALPDYTNEVLNLGTVGDYTFFIPMSKIYTGPAIDGYEIKTLSAGGSDASITISSIRYNEYIRSSQLLDTLIYNGHNSFSDDVISVRYNNGWVLEFTDALYKTDGTQWTSPQSWSYNTTVDHILLEENPV